MLQKLEIFSASTLASLSEPDFLCGYYHSAKVTTIILNLFSSLLFFFYRSSVQINNIRSLLSSPTLNFSPINHWYLCLKRYHSMWHFNLKLVSQIITIVVSLFDNDNSSLMALCQTKLSLIDINNSNHLGLASSFQKIIYYPVNKLEQNDGNFCPIRNKFIFLTLESYKFLLCEVFCVQYITFQTYEFTWRHCKLINIFQIYVDAIQNIIELLFCTIFHHGWHLINYIGWTRLNNQLRMDVV